MKIILYIAFLCFGFEIFAQTSSNEDSMYTLTIPVTNLQHAINYIHKTTGIEFIYTTSAISNIYIAQQVFQNDSLSTILNMIIPEEKIKWFHYKNKIVLIPRESSRPIFISGKIIDTHTKSSVPNTSVYIANANSGTVADRNGEFKLCISNEYVSDSVCFSFLGYTTKKHAIKNLVKNSYNIIQLHESTIDLPQISIAAKSFKKKTLGNSKGRVKGTIYMDTHGQQTALYIPNDENLQGIVKSVQFYLSDEGNTDAPFRLRLYAKDTVTGKPGTDLLEEFFIVRPKIERGWYTIDLYTYRIQFPKYGLFVGIEGIFPNEYSYYLSDDNYDSNTEYTHTEQIPEVISYGQKIGYTKQRKQQNNTWHYSLAGTWFQLRKNDYGAMINAQIQYVKN